MSWLFSQALVEEFLVGNSSDGAQSVQSSGSHTQLAYLPPDKMTAFSRLSRYGMTFKPLTPDLGQELLMLFRAAFPAKTSALPDGVTDLTGNAQECGSTWRGWLAKFDPDSCSWKTAQCSLIEEEPESLETLPRWGMTRGGLLWERPMSERRINATDSGSWPTPATKGYGHAAEGMVSNLIDKIERGIITKQEAEQMLSLPNLENHRTWKKKFTTPTAHNWKETNAPSESQRNTPTLAAQVGGKLNPSWVEWLMGWPPGWTDLKPLEMGKSPSAPLQPGEN